MWSDEWLLRLHIDKCKSVSYCIKHPVNTDYHILNRDQLFPLEKVQSMADLGVCFDSNLTFKDHMSEKVNKAYSVLGIIKRNFTYTDGMNILLYHFISRWCALMSNMQIRFGACLRYVI